jgi:predicted Zn-dependent peptidase
MLLATTLALGVAMPAAAQKQAPPPVGPPKDFHLPQKREFALPNGMAVTLVPFGRVPKVAVILTVQAGRINERPDQTGLSSVTAALMQEGTRTRTAAQLAEDVAGMGGSRDVSSNNELTTVGGEVLSEHAAGMVRLVADVARNPQLPASELPRIKADQVRDLSIQKSQPQAIALDRFRSILYDDHPYGRLFPDEDALGGFTVAQVRAFHAANFGARRAHLYVAGVFDGPATEAAVRQAFRGWAAGRPQSRPVPKPKAVRSLTLIDRPNAPQSTIVMGLPVPDPVESDYVALRVTDGLLGGTFGSRITTNIRERKGYSYAPYSTVTNFWHQSYWSEQADVTTSETGNSLKEIFGEIDRLRKKAPAERELAGIERNLAGIFTVQNSSRNGIIGQLAFADVQGLPDSYLTGYVKRLLAVTPEQVRSMAERHLAPDRMTIVVVGDKKTVEKQVAPYRAAAGP